MTVWSSSLMPRRIKYHLHLKRFATSNISLLDFVLMLANFNIRYIFTLAFNANWIYTVVSDAVWQLLLSLSSFFS